MTLERALKMNPYDETKGNKSAYARYLRYNVYGWYNKTNEEVRKLWKERENEMQSMRKTIPIEERKQVHR